MLAIELRIEFIFFNYLNYTTLAYTANGDWGNSASNAGINNFICPELSGIFKPTLSSQVTQLQQSGVPGNAYRVAHAVWCCRIVWRILLATESG
jgi:hypothetical protein